jgi:hypothetical protein
MQQESSSINRSIQSSKILLFSDISLLVDSISNGAYMISKPVLFVKAIPTIFHKCIIPTLALIRISK